MTPTDTASLFDLVADDHATADPAPRPKAEPGRAVALGILPDAPPPP